MTEDKGEVCINGDTVSIPIFARAVDGKPRQVVGRTLVDLDDYNDTVKDSPIWMNPHGRKKYAVCSVNGKPMQLSHAVAGKPPRGHVKDHINGDSLDNRCANLRDVTRRLNSQNRVKAKGKSSRYIGVSWSKQSSKWAAQAHSPDANVHLGFHTSEVEAAKTYDRYIIQHYGQDGKTNGVLSEDEIDAALADDAKQPVTRKKKSGLPRGVYVEGKLFMTQFTDENGVKRRASYDTVEGAKAKYDTETARVAQVLEDRHLAKSITRNADGDAIIVTNQYRGVKRDVLVSEHQWHALARRGWSWTGPYPQGVVNGKTIRMHLYVWQLANPDQVIPDGCEVDHIRHDIGDCRVESLRLTTRAANSQNKRKRAGTSSQYIGVSRSRVRWRAGICVNRKQVDLGTFDNEIDAARAYNDAVDKYYPDGKKNVLPSVRSRKRVTV